VASATGHDHEVLGRRVWDIAPFKGKTGHIEVVDATAGGWGHIMVDEILQWVKTAP
jgi:levanase